MLLSALLFVFLGHADNLEPKIQLDPKCAGSETLSAYSPFTRTCDEGKGKELEITFVVERDANGKTREIYSWKEINKKNGIFDGAFTEWSRNKNFKRIKGQFSNGTPSGNWSVYGYSSNEDHYDIKYQNGNVAEIVLRKENEKPTVFQVEKLAALPAEKKQIIGFFSNSKIDPYIPGSYVSDQMTFDHILFYSSYDKKKIVGAAISDYRFYPQHVCTSIQCDPENGTDMHEWYVYEKKGNMCLTFMPAKNFSNGYKLVTSNYKFWFECEEGFRDVYERYKGTLMGISKDAKVYSSAGGKLVKIKGIEKLKSDEDFGVDILEKKMVGKDLWVKISLSTGQCSSEEGDYFGEYWVPFFVDSEINLIRYGRGC